MKTFGIELEHLQWYTVDVEGVIHEMQYSEKKELFYKSLYPLEKKFFTISLYSKKINQIKLSKKTTEKEKEIEYDNEIKKIQYNLFIGDEKTNKDISELSSFLESFCKKSNSIEFEIMHFRRKVKALKLSLSHHLLAKNLKGISEVLSLGKIIKADANKIVNANINTKEGRQLLKDLCLVKNEEIDKCALIKVSPMDELRFNLEIYPKTAQSIVDLDSDLTTWLEKLELIKDVLIKVRKPITALNLEFVGAIKFHRVDELKVFLLEKDKTILYMDNVLGIKKDNFNMNMLIEFNNLKK